MVEPTEPPGPPGTIDLMAYRLYRQMAGEAHPEVVPGEREHSSGSYKYIWQCNCGSVRFQLHADHALECSDCGMVTYDHLVDGGGNAA